MCIKPLAILVVMLVLTSDVVLARKLNSTEENRNNDSNTTLHNDTKTTSINITSVQKQNLNKEVDKQQAVFENNLSRSYQIQCLLNGLDLCNDPNLGTFCCNPDSKNEQDQCQKTPQTVCTDNFDDSFKKFSFLWSEKYAQNENDCSQFEPFDTVEAHRANFNLAKTFKCNCKDICLHNLTINQQPIYKDDSFKVILKIDQVQIDNSNLVLLYTDTQGIKQFTDCLQIRIKGDTLNPESNYACTEVDPSFDYKAISTIKANSQIEPQLYLLSHGAGSYQFNYRTEVVQDRPTGQSSIILQAKQKFSLGQEYFQGGFHKIINTLDVDRTEQFVRLTAQVMIILLAITCLSCSLFFTYCYICRALHRKQAQISIQVQGKYSESQLDHHLPSQQDSSRIPMNASNNNHHRINLRKNEHPSDLTLPQTARSQWEVNVAADTSMALVGTHRSVSKGVKDWVSQKEKRLLFDDKGWANIVKEQNILIDQVDAVLDPNLAPTARQHRELSKQKKELGIEDFGVGNFIQSEIGKKQEEVEFTNIQDIPIQYKKPISVLPPNFREDFKSKFESFYNQQSETKQRVGIIRAELEQEPVTERVFKQLHKLDHIQLDQDTQPQLITPRKKMKKKKKKKLAVVNSTEELP